MTSPKFVFCLICLFVGKMAQITDPKLPSSVHQERRFVSANVGENVTLQCFYERDNSAWLYWFKQTLGQKPRLISTFYVYDRRTTFYHEFKNNQRFTLLDTVKGANHLTIYDLDISDSATYYCATSYTFVLTFAEGTTVSVKGSGLKVPASVLQSASEPIQPGGSVTLNCTVHTGTCDGEHSVYWFKTSEESHPGLIYTHGGRNDLCERKSSTQTHTCVYNLALKSLNLSHAGTYYCAVASCGHVLFGNGTKLEIEHEVDSLVLVYFLSGALTFTTILIVLLAFLVYKIIKKNNCQCTESQARLSSPSTTTSEGYRDADSLHYAALNVNLPNRSRKQRNNTNSECVYSSVKQ
ncbi:immunoglobulin kappa light chain-like [Micropterus dolomieu]|uniref:immunoglobulin kappa light chain-like n=1 Tax=Micropterus dolomieu TaxID=147949 RepID=UPI001E8CBBE9|nr:immunoglobulin kappa light chain-like [Micropterus dolomieu]